MRRIAAASLVIVGFLAFRGIAAAQELGIVAGVVKDRSGAVLRSVTVRVASVELFERVRTTVTDASGQYQVVNLPVSAYTVTFSLAGFSPVVRVGIEVSAGLTTAVDGDMNVGLLDHTSTVPGRRPLVNIPAAAQLRPYVRCGLTIVPADPKVDPRIRMPFDHAQGGAWSRTAHSMRTIAPQMCTDK